MAICLLLTTRLSQAQTPYWQLDAKLTADDAVPGIGFGDAVSIFGLNEAWVGATANGVANVSAGAVYGLTRNLGDTWKQYVKLTAADGELDDRFGWSISSHEGVLAIGAPEDDDLGGGSGSAYIFRSDGDGWPQEKKLTADDGQPSDHFGRSVGAHGDVVVVGAPDAPGDGGPTGAAYVYRAYDKMNPQGASWQQEQKLQVGTYATIGKFGASVAASGDRVLIGVPNAGPGAQNLGAAYVFKFDGQTWQQEAVLSASDQDPQDMFGSSVALDGDVALIGVPQDEDGGVFAGAANVFRFVSGTWQEEGKLLADDPAEDDRFGTSVSLGLNKAIVGAPGSGRMGAAYVFHLTSGSWILVQKIVPEDPGIGGNFGQSVSISHTSSLSEGIIVGASNNDDGGESAGSVYVFKRALTGTATENVTTTSFASSVHLYPNPVNEIATLAYELEKPSWVRVSVYDALGRRVLEQPIQYRSAGLYSDELRTDGLSTGVYLVTLDAQGTITSLKIIRAD